MVQRQKTTKIGLFLIGLVLFLFGVIMAQFWEDLVLTRFYSKENEAPVERKPHSENVKSLENHSSDTDEYEPDNEGEGGPSNLPIESNAVGQPNEGGPSNLPIESNAKGQPNKGGSSNLPVESNAKGQPTLGENADDSDSDSSFDDDGSVRMDTETFYQTQLLGQEGQDIYEDGGKKKKRYIETSLHPGSLGYREWKFTKVPIKTSFYFWNWTNPEQINDESVKPHFVETGPYVFWQSREKVDLSYNSENETVTYKNKLYFYFDPELSNGSLSDEVTSINMIAASAAYMTRTWSKFFLYGLSMFLRSSGQQVHWTKSVRQLLFEGFENPVQKLSTYIPGYDGPDKFGWMYGFNNTVQPGIINIDSGKSDINKIGQIYFVNYKNESDVYPDCREIKGSNAEFFAPFITPERRLEMYLPEMCRRVFHYYDGESTYEGLKTYVFSATKETFDDGRVVPENKCYCVDDDCPPSGIFDISRCASGAPIGMSLPHFLYADPYYRDGIEGMNPDEMNHKYYAALEPTTSIQINVSAKVQINVRLSRNTGLSLFRNVPNVYIPVLWQENQALLKGDYLSGIKLLVFFLQYGAHICYGTSGAGFVIIVFVALYHLYNQNSLKQIKRNLANKTQEAAKKAEEQKLKNGDENDKEIVKYVISDDKAVIVD